MSGKSVPKRAKASQIGTGTKVNSTCNIVSGSAVPWVQALLYLYRVYPIVRRKVSSALNNNEIYVLASFAAYLEAKELGAAGVDSFLSTVTGSPGVKSRIAGGLKGLREKGYLNGVAWREYTRYEITPSGYQVVSAFIEGCNEMQQRYNKAYRRQVA